MNNDNINNNNKNNNNYARCVREHEFGFKELYTAYLACRKRKRSTINALRFEANLECNIEKLVYDLNQRTYKPSRSVCFTILKPKPREIFAADFRDRIVHHLLYNYLNPIYENIFIHDSYACRKNKGTLASVKRLQKFTRSITQNNKRHAYYLQLDIHNFFMSIDKHILYNQIKKKIHDASFDWLARKLIFNDPTTNYIQKSPSFIKNKVPKHKSLPNQKPNKGLPIGNLTSQFFANVYLNELDQFVKHNLKEKYYVRYVDDFIILSESKKHLISLKKKIVVFLKNKLNLKLKDLEILKPISNGINFAGFIIKPFYFLPRNRNIQNLKRKVFLFQKKSIVSTDKSTTLLYEFIPYLRQVLNSYLGYLRPSKHKTIIKTLFHNFSFLSVFFILIDKKFINIFETKSISFFNQYLHFRNLAKGFIIFIQTGNHYKVLGKEVFIIIKHFDYCLSTTKKYSFVSIPSREMNFVLASLKKMRYKYIIIRQSTSRKPFLRCMDYAVLPIHHSQHMKNMV